MRLLIYTLLVVGAFLAGNRGDLSAVTDRSASSPTVEAITPPPEAPQTRAGK